MPRRPVHAVSILASLAAVLAACGGGSGGGSPPPPPVQVTIQPGTAGVLPGGTLALTAQVSNAKDQTVAWSVTEGDAGGRVDAAGHYTAPATSGTYHVVATSAADRARSATASIVVGTSFALPADRATEWKPGVTYNGGIPHRTQVCATLRPLGAGKDDTKQLQDAIAACPDGQVVQLGAGTFLLGVPGQYTYADAHLRIERSNITLRGTTDASGEPATTLQTPCTFAPGEKIQCNGAVVVGTLWVHPDAPGQSVAITADVAKESRQVTVASNPGYQVGETVLVDEETDGDLTWWSRRCSPECVGKDQVCDYPACRTWFIRDNRPIGQVNEIAAVNGNVLTFSAPFHMPYRTSHHAQVARFGQANGHMPTTRVGIEDLKVSGGSGGDQGGNVHFYGASYSWARNVEADRSGGTSINFDASFRCELRDSYVHSTIAPRPGGGGYGIGFNFHAADNLVENSISWNFNKVMVMRASGGGNVIGYSYFDDGWIDYAACYVETGMNASHYATSVMELFEGNRAFNFASDSTWGNSIYVTVFRNHLTGLRGAYPPLDAFTQDGLYYEDQGNRRAADVGPYHYWSTFLGNVLGHDGQQPLAHPRSQGQGGFSRFAYEFTPATQWEATPMWQVAWLDSGTQEPKTVATLIRHGNFDYVTRAPVWDPAIAQHALPASLYLTAAPPFMAGHTWPPVDPSSGATYPLPAKERFDRLHAVQ